MCRPESFLEKDAAILFYFTLEMCQSDYLGDLILYGCLNVMRWEVKYCKDNEGNEFFYFLLILLLATENRHSQ